MMVPPSMPERRETMRKHIHAYTHKHIHACIHTCMFPLSVWLMPCLDQMVRLECSRMIQNDYVQLLSRHAARTRKSAPDFARGFCISTSVNRQGFECFKADSVDVNYSLLSEWFSTVAEHASDGHIYPKHRLLSNAFIAVDIDFKGALSKTESSSEQGSWAKHETDKASQLIAYMMRQYRRAPVGAKTLLTGKLKSLMSKCNVPRASQDEFSGFDSDLDAYQIGDSSLYDEFLPEYPKESDDEPGELKIPIPIPIPIYPKDDASDDDSASCDSDADNDRASCEPAIEISSEDDVDELRPKQLSGLSAAALSMCDTLGPVGAAAHRRLVAAPKAKAKAKAKTKTKTKTKKRAINAGAPNAPPKRAKAAPAAHIGIDPQSLLMPTGHLNNDVFLKELLRLLSDAVCGPQPGITKTMPKAERGHGLFQLVCDNQVRSGRFLTRELLLTGRLMRGIIGITIRNRRYIRNPVVLWFGRATS